MYRRFLSKPQGFAGLCGALWFVGCADGADRESSSLLRSPIVNGQRSVATDDSVVQLIAKPPGSLPVACSGVLIAPNLVLSAMHCVAQFGDGSFSCNSDGTISTASPGAGSLGELASPDQIAVRVGVFPSAAPDALGVKVFGTGTNQVCRNDLALIVLDRDLPLPIASLRLESGVALGEMMRAVGYGATEVSGSAGRFERDHLRVIDRGQDAGGSTASNAAPRTFVVGEGPCHGDSGGPIFSQETGAVVGVYSLAAGPSCTAVGVRNVYTRLAPFADLVGTAFAFIGGAPLEEQSPSGGASESGGANDGGSAGSASGSAGNDSGGGSAAPTAGDATAGKGVTQRPGGSGSRQSGGCAFSSARSASAPGPETGPLLALLALLWFGRASRRSAWSAPAGRPRCEP